MLKNRYLDRFLTISPLTAAHFSAVEAAAFHDTKQRVYKYDHFAFGIGLGIILMCSAERHVDDITFYFSLALLACLWWGHYRIEKSAENELALARQHMYEGFTDEFRDELKKGGPFRYFF